ncbi:MAG: ABC transporter ATP-binding protein [Candidatus Binatia bacterium]
MSRLVVTDVSHAFGGLLAVQDFNLAIGEREVVGLIGPNGAGKTTVFNLLTGVYRPRRGSIRLDGQELVGLPQHRIVALGVARTFQNIRLFGRLTALDNVRTAFYARGEASSLAALLRLPSSRAEERRVIAQAHALLDAFGLAPHAHAAAGDLPYGLQRRLEVARALATRPRLLALDEPAAGMNPAEIQQMMRFIGWVRERFALPILLIEHQMTLVMGLCERIVVLDAGRTIATGTPEEIRRDPAVLAAYLGTDDHAAPAAG